MSSWVFNERHLGGFLHTLFSSELYDFADHTFELTVIYTMGKSSLWPESTRAKQGTAGVVGGAFLIPKRKVAAGAALIDLEVTLPKGGLSIVAGGIGRIGRAGPAKPSFRRSRPRLEDYRLKTLTTVAHEMVHCIQAWREGNVLVGEDDLETPHNRIYTDRFLELMEKFEEAHPSWSDQTIAERAYMKHPHELQARQFAQGRIRKISRSIERGAWDTVLPIKAMKARIARASVRHGGQ